MAQSASVRLVGPATYSGRGHRFRRGESKIISDAGDINYFASCSHFKVVAIGNDGKATARKVAPKRTAAAPKASQKQDSGDDEVLPWRVGMKKAELIEAAESRGIAVTKEDKVPQIVQLLKEWDDTHKSADGDDDDGDEDDTDDDGDE